ncbi:MAG TPA: SMI1/KNR4 family protein [Ramlibacter sp.]
MQERHRANPAVPLYDSGANPGASAAELAELRSVLVIEPPPELLESLRRWNGRWILHDHVIDLAPIQSYMYYARLDDDFERRATARDKREHERMTFERVVGPINPNMNSRRRIPFGAHEYSGSALYIDFEDPPEGGRPGQIIRIGEEPVAEIVALSFIEFLNMVAAAPLHDDDPDLDPLRGGSAT